MANDNLDTRYAAFNAACREPDRDTEPAAWMPECSGFASDRDIHPSRLSWLFYVALAAIVAALVMGVLQP